MKRRTDHLFSLRGGLLLLGWFVFAACLCGCGGEAQPPAWEDFCAEMEQNFSENPDVLTPNYIDLDGWCYFLAEDSRQIYRFSQVDPQPEAIIQNAWGCMTVMEEGVLFLRGHENYIGSLFWDVQYDLILWQDGVETILWKNADIDSSDNNLVTVGDFLIYCGKSKMRVRPLMLEGAEPHVGKCIGDIPDIYDTQNLVWCDGKTLWYGVEKDTGSTAALRKMTLRTKAYTDQATTGWRSTGWDARHPWPLAVQNQQLYYVENGKLYVQTLDQLTARELRDIPENEEVNVYMTSTGEVMTLTKDHRRGQYTAQALSAGWSLEAEDRVMVETVFGNIAVVKRREYIDGYNYYLRTELYRVNTQAKTWVSSGKLYMETN